MGSVFKHFEIIILLPVIILIGFSIAVISSINPELVLSQSLYYIAGFLLFFTISFLDKKFLQSLAWWMYGISIFALLLAFVGPDVRGSTRWIDFFGLRIQPSEIIKPLLLVSQAHYLAKTPKLTAKKILMFLALFLLPTILVFKQPDLGNSIIYAVTMVCLIFIAGIPLRYIITVFFSGGILLPILWRFLKDYQKQRLEAFLNPHIDQTGISYHAIQSMIAVGTGQLFGRGLGRGPQSQLRFLPENHTDFIFASLTEELGFFGGSLVILSYFILLFKILTAVRVTRDVFDQYILVGVFIQLFLHVVINLGMNMGLLPVTGITLPFISYGGSSILSFFCLLGLAHNIIVRNKKLETIAIR